MSQDKPHVWLSWDIPVFKSEFGRVSFSSFSDDVHKASEPCYHGQHTSNHDEGIWMRLPSVAAATLHCQGVCMTSYSDAMISSESEHCDISGVIS